MLALVFSIVTDKRWMKRPAFDASVLDPQPRDISRERKRTRLFVDIMAEGWSQTSTPSYPLSLLKEGVVSSLSFVLGYSVVRLYHVARQACLGTVPFARAVPSRAAFGVQTTKPLTDVWRLSGIPMSATRCFSDSQTHKQHLPR